MLQGKSERVNLLYVISAMVIMFGTVSIALFQVPIIVIIKYSFMQILGVILPGITVVSILKQKGKLFEMIGLAYAIGYAINLIEYYMLYSLHLQEFAFAVVVLIAVVCILYFNKNREKLLIEIDQDINIISIIFVIYLLINMVIYAGNMLSPIQGQGISLPRDMQFWLANTVSLKLSFPAEVVYMSDSTLFYHYFSSMHTAFWAKALNLDVFVLGVTLYPLGRCILFIGGINYLLNLFDVKRIKPLLLIAVLFMTGFESLSVVTYIWHTITAPFGCDIGLSFAFWFLAMMLKQWRQAKFDRGIYVLVMLFWFTLSGVKAPIGMILMLVPGVFCFTWLFQRKYKMAFSYGLSVLGVFAAVSIFVAGALRATESIGIRLYTQAELINDFVNRGLGDNIILGCALSIVLSHPFLIILFLWASYAFIKNFPTDFAKKMEGITLVITTIIGLIFGVIVFAGGRSEMYFTMAAYIPCIAFIAYVISLNSCLGHEKYTCKYVVYPIVMLACFGVVCTVIFSRGSILENTYYAYKKITHNYEYSQTDFLYDEAKVCEWIRNNTPLDSVILSDRSTVGEQKNSYYQGVFSERVQYIEASDLIMYLDIQTEYDAVETEIEERYDNVIRFFEGDIVAYETICREGVDYVIRNSRLTPEFQPDEKYLQLEYTSGDVSVYSIKEQ